MKKLISILSALAIMCSLSIINTVSVNAMEAATYQEFITQRKEIVEYPDPDMKYISLINNDLEFRLYDEFAVLSECTDRNITEVEIPSEIKGLPVVGSVGSPFGRCRTLKKIVIPDTFEHFEWLDFVCTTITTISLPNTSAAIIGSSVSALSSSPKTASDSDVLIPSVAEVVVSDTNPYYSSVDGLIYTKNMKTLIGCPPAKEIKEIKISGQTERINDYAFFGCYNLERAVIPNNIKHINNGVFLGCINLETIEFPKSITSISGDMCYGCESLSNVVFNGIIEKIGYGAFSECHALESFEIPDTVTYIGNYAFENCGCIEDIDGVYYVDNWVVGSNEAVTNVDIKGGTVGIAEWSFITRNNMNYINVPSSVQYLGYLTFAQLSSSKTKARMDYRCSFIEENTIAAAKSTADFYIYDAECDIFDSEKTIPAKYRYTDYIETDNGYGTFIDGKFYDEVKVEEDTVIHGYANSTAQAYAEKYNRKFELIEKNNVKGDVNGDDEFNITDVVMLQKWLLGTPDTKLSNWKAADLCDDGVLNVFDLCMMKRELINKSNDHIDEIKSIIPGLKNGMPAEEVFSIIGTDYLETMEGARGRTEYFYPFKDSDAFGTNLEGNLFIEIDSKTNTLANFGYHLGRLGNDKKRYYPYTEAELKTAYNTIMMKLMEWYGESIKGTLDSPIEENIWNIDDDQIWAVYGVNLWGFTEPDVYEEGINEIVISCSYEPTK